MQRRILRDRKVSFGKVNKSTEVWKSTHVVPEPQVIENDKGVGEGGRREQGQDHECFCMSCYGF